jgi:N-methylhydantoinase A/oxoprolinase/acetone carboxylase beta subunit
VVTLRARRVVSAPKIDPPRQTEPGDPEVGRTTSRWDGRDHETPILERARLRDGTIQGPALITEYSATTYLPPGCDCEIEGGLLRLTLRR